jgi:ATP-dependent DNA ligase
MLGFNCFFLLHSEFFSLYKKTMKNFPTLYHKGKNGELRQWRTWADQDFVYTQHGLVGGAIQESCKKCMPKNVGKKNATTCETQAMVEAESLHKFKLTRKYSLTPEEAQTPLMLPMLAHKYDPKKHIGAFYCQPKLDGVRCIARWVNDKVVLFSRQGKIYDVKHISDELEKFLGKDDVFDGELYIHGMQLQSQISLVKKPQPESAKIEYWVYDMPVVKGDDSLGFSTRNLALNDALNGYYINLGRDRDLSKIIQVVTFHIPDSRSASDVLPKFVSQGFEGAILRGPQSEYLWGYRSNELLKVKAFQDSEFKIVDIVEGEGKMEGHAIFVCQNDLNDRTFKCVPKMTMEQRSEIWNDRETYIGNFVTVSYFDRTEDQVPRFPVAIAVRNYE